MSLAEKIKDNRKRIGFTQELLAEKLGVSRQAVSKWEIGESIPSTQNVIGLAQIFGIDEKELTEKSELKLDKKLNMVDILSFCCLLFAFLPFCISIIAHNFLPPNIPAHYNINGEIDRWGNRIEYLVIGIVFSAVAVSFYFLIHFIIRRNSLKKRDVIIVSSALLLMPVSYTVLQMVFTVKAMSFSVPDKGVSIINTMWTCINAITLLAALAFPKLKPNAIFGIRTSRTLKSVEIWDKTHKVGAVTIISGSVIGGLMAALLSNYYALFSVLPFTIGVLFPVFYSYRIAKS